VFEGGMTVRVAIVGDGVAAALAGAVLSGRGAAVVRVPTGENGTGLGPFGPALLGLPEWQESELAAKLGPIAGAGFALGIAFSGWAAGGNAWFLPFGDIGAPLGGISFAQVANRLRACGHSLRLADFSLAAMAAQAERFAPPSPDPRSPASTLAMGTHLPASALTQALERLTGIRTSAPLTKVVARDGRVAHLALADDQQLDADLYVDATGEAARLMSAVESGWTSWRDWLPCTRAAVSATPETLPPPPYGFHVADRDGWTATIPLNGVRVAVRFSIDGTGTAFENGLRCEAWRGNCVAIGAAAGVVEPVLGSPLLLALRQVQRLATLLPHAADHQTEAAEYNRVTASELERARDAAVALWATNGRVGDRVWDGARGRADASLQRTLDLFRSRGRVPLYDDDLMSEADWIALLDGQGLRPRRLDPIASGISDERMLAHAARLRERLVATVKQMPRHADQLARLGSRT
jgi:tryptophan halogenase